MKKNIKKIIVLTSLSLAFFFFASCTEDDITPSLTEIAPDPLAPPVIVSVDPPQEALAGITTLTITGNNFSATKENNSVYFNGLPGTVISSTSTQLEVVSAVVIADTVLVKVSVTGADQFSNTLVYKLKAAVTELYPFNPALSEFPYAITIDGSENVYTSLSGKGTKKIDPQGNISDFATGTTATAFFTSMTFASDNSIYAVKRIKGVYKVSENTNPVAFISSAQGVTDNINSINFDKTRNVLWAGGSTGIVYRITFDKNVKKYNINGNINSLKVVQNNLFIASTSDNKEVIWKVPIISADSLGSPVMYFDFSSEVDSVIKIIDIVTAQDGDLYIGTNKAADPIYVVHPDYSFETFYPGILNSAVYSLVWGNDKYLYMANTVNNVNTTILKIDMQKLGPQ